MSLTHLSDFPDRLSPMLVKELRQGLRARGFTVLFLGLQLMLALILISTGGIGAAMGSDSAGTAASGTIFTLFGIAVLGIQPMRGANALSSEVTANTLEMMSLTRLTASRIVFGKWFAIVGQSALLLTTIVPYLMLRYFFGGMNLMGELVALVLMFLTSMALTAVMVGLSGNANKMARVFPVILFFILIQTLPTFLMRSALGGGMGGGMGFFALTDWHSRIAVACYIGFIGYLGWCALSHGISSIAPMAENHSTPRRLVALVLTCAVAAATFDHDFDLLTTALFLAVILLPALIPALTEPAHILPPVCHPFIKRGFIGKTAALFLLPGWPTGVFFTCLLAAISLAAMVNSAISSSTGMTVDAMSVLVFGLACLGIILLPALLSACFTKQETKRFATFMLFLVVTAIIAVGGMLLSGVRQEFNFLWLFIWDPLTLIFMLVSGKFQVPDLALAATVVVGSLLAILVVVALIRYKDYLRVFRETEAAGITNNPVPDLPVTHP
jgi:hypothetical protein